MRDGLPSRHRADTASLEAALRDLPRAPVPEGLAERLVAAIPACPGHRETPLRDGRPCPWRCAASAAGRRARPPTSPRAAAAEAGRHGAPPADTSSRFILDPAPGPLSTEETRLHATSCPPCPRLVIALSRGDSPPHRTGDEPNQKPPPGPPRARNARTAGPHQPRGRGGEEPPAQPRQAESGPGDVPLGLGRRLGARARVDGPRMARTTDQAHSGRGDSGHRCYDGPTDRPSSFNWAQPLAEVPRRPVGPGPGLDQDGGGRRRQRLPPVLGRAGRYARLREHALGLPRRPGAWTGGPERTAGRHPARDRPRRQSSARGLDGPGQGLVRRPRGVIEGGEPRAVDPAPMTYIKLDSPSTSDLDGATSPSASAVEPPAIDEALALAPGSGAGSSGHCRLPRTARSSPTCPAGTTAGSTGSRWPTTTGGRTGASAP